MNFFDDEQSWHEAQDEYMSRYAPPATMSDAHAEWHRNSGNPMGTPGCPMDACHLPDPEPEHGDYDMDDTNSMGVPWCYACDGYATCGEYEPDGAPAHQWEVTEPEMVYYTEDDPRWGDFQF